VETFGDFFKTWMKKISFSKYFSKNDKNYPQNKLVIIKIINT
jgi:hypothetical protein